MPIKREREVSEFNNSNREEEKESVSRIAETLDRHSDKSATDIFPRPERFITKTKKTKKRTQIGKLRERLNATFNSSILNPENEVSSIQDNRTKK
jgi:hypothetical protein